MTDNQPSGYVECVIHEFYFVASFRWTDVLESRETTRTKETGEIIKETEVTRTRTNHASHHGHVVLKTAIDSPEATHVGNIYQRVITYAKKWAGAPDHAVIVHLSLEPAAGLLDKYKTGTEFVPQGDLS